jgi:hypothetical protein
VTQSLSRRLVLLLSSLVMVAACGSNESANPAAKWIGKTYLFDAPSVSSQHWTKPKNFDAGPYIPQFFFKVEAGSGSDLAITLASGYDNTQDLCSVTTQVTTTGANFPSVEISAGSFPMHIQDFSTAHPARVASTAHDVRFTDILPGDGEATDGRIDAVVNIAELYPLFFQVPEPRDKDSVCSTLKSGSSGSVTCQACSFNNSEPYCLSLTAVQIGATETSTQIRQVSAGDIGASCN